MSTRHPRTLSPTSWPAEKAKSPPCSRGSVSPKHRVPHTVCCHSSSRHSTPLAVKSKMNLNRVDDVSSLDIAPWTLSAPTVRFDLTKFRKDTTNPETYKQFYLQFIVTECPLSEIFSLMFRKQNKESLRWLAVSTKRSLAETFYLSASGRQLCIYNTAELRAILLALKHVCCSRGR